jgi:hypothetical protein
MKKLLVSLIALSSACSVFAFMPADGGNRQGIYKNQEWVWNTLGKIRKAESYSAVWPAQRSWLLAFSQRVRPPKITQSLAFSQRVRPPKLAFSQPIKPPKI